MNLKSEVWKSYFYYKHNCIKAQKTWKHEDHNRLREKTNAGFVKKHKKIFSCDKSQLEGMTSLSFTKFIKMSGKNGHVTDVASFFQEV